MDSQPEKRASSQLSNMLEEILIAGSPRSSLGGRRSSGVRPVRVTTDDEGRSLLPPGERADGHDTSQPPSAKTDGHSRWGAHASDGKSTPGAQPFGRSSRPSPRHSLGGDRKRSEEDRSKAHKLASIPACAPAAYWRLSCHGTLAKPVVAPACHTTTPVWNHNGGRAEGCITIYSCCLQGCYHRLLSRSGHHLASLATCVGSPTPTWVRA